MTAETDVIETFNPKLNLWRLKNERKIRECPDTGNRIEQK